LYLFRINGAGGPPTKICRSCACYNNTNDAP